ncbi:hypothetical protein Pla110_24050 [Polystyrenella longa]|uniref:Uncharacterized protein n=1 Tax=Polystyrenella longa TaxID=2528007 RepID=A0A518CN87_9PLAN|nr:hypothetical protein Pla110_24050 [Polystyrenella longa]
MLSTLPKCKYKTSQANYVAYLQLHKYPLQPLFSTQYAINVPLWGDFHAYAAYLDLHI